MANGFGKDLSKAATILAQNEADYANRLLAERKLAERAQQEMRKLRLKTATDILMNPDKHTKEGYAGALATVRAEIGDENFLPGLAKPELTEEEKQLEVLKALGGDAEGRFAEKIGLIDPAEPEGMTGYQRELLKLRWAQLRDRKKRRMDDNTKKLTKEFLQERTDELNRSIRQGTLDLEFPSDELKRLKSERDRVEQILQDLDAGEDVRADIIGLQSDISVRNERYNRLLESLNVIRQLRDRQIPTGGFPPDGPTPLLPGTTPGTTLPQGVPEPIRTQTAARQDAESASTVGPEDIFPERVPLQLRDDFFRERGVGGFEAAAPDVTLSGAAARSQPAAPTAQRVEEMSALVDKLRSAGRQANRSIEEIARRIDAELRQRYNVGLAEYVELRNRARR